MPKVNEKDDAFDASQYAFFGAGADAGASGLNLLDGELGGLEDDDDGLGGGLHGDDEGLGMDAVNDDDTFGDSDRAFPSSHHDGGGAVGELSSDLGSLSLKQVIMVAGYLPPREPRNPRILVYLVGFMGVDH